MELALRIHIEELPEGAFLATSEQLPGLIAQGRTIAETLEIARDVARRLIAAQRERNDRALPLSPTTNPGEYTIVVPA
jgi:predicted RNase H-like HicB family nuclease